MTTLTRNRDLPAFVRNPDPPWAPGCAERAEHCAIDSNLSVLEVRTSKAAQVPGCPLGSLTFFAMHPTVLSNTNQLLGADAFGVASRVLEAELRQVATQTGQCAGDPVAGIVNTNEGDMAPRWTSSTVEQTITVGGALAAEVRAATSVPEAAAGFDANPPIAGRYVEAALGASAFGMQGGAATCPEPELGMFGAFGGSDHPTFIEPFEGQSDPRDPFRHDCQAPKRAFFPLARRASRGKQAFPTIVPFAVSRIGQVAIAFVPAEMTIAAGREVKRAVEHALASAPDREFDAAGRPQPIHAIVGGLTNGYIQYVTTEAEYDVQGYEGTSNLFGKRSSTLIANIAGALAARLYDDQTALPRDVDTAHDYEYWTGPARHRLPDGSGESTLDELGTQRHPIAFCSIPGARPAAVCFLWTDGAPGVVPSSSPGWISVTGEGAAGGPPKLLLDDRGIEFRTRIHRPYGDAWIWSTLVQPSQLGPGRSLTWWDYDLDAPFRIRIAAGTKYEIASAKFRAAALPGMCSAELQRICGI